MKDWFEGITDVTDLRNRYRELIKLHHPDNGGNVAVMQEINATYDAKLKQIREGMADCEQERYDDASDNEFKAILNKIVNFNVDVEIIGCWIWCFNSYAYRQQLKELGFTYASKKKAWCWHLGEFKRKYRKEIDINKIRGKYGSKNVRKCVDESKLTG